MDGNEILGKSSQTVRNLIRNHYDDLTQSERKLANSLLENYPASGLASITMVAENASVSTPTVARMVQKLGFKGFPQFHNALREELEAKFSGPIEKRENWASEVPNSHLLNRFADSIMQNLTQTLSHIDTNRFDEVVKLLSRHEHHLYIVGGRITRALADYSFTHLQAIRPKVTHMTSSSATWPHYVLDMQAGDVLVIFDVRRYETNLLRLAKLANEREIKIVLITDQWASPISKIADYTFNGWVEIPSAWDSNVAIMMVVETLIAGVQEEIWPQTKERFKRLDELFDMTRLFKKFNS